MTLYSITEYEFCCSFIFAILKWTNSQPTAYRDCLPEEKSILFFVDRLMLLKKVLKNCLSWTEITLDDIIYGWHFEQHCYNKVAFSIIGNIQMIKMLVSLELFHWHTLIFLITVAQSSTTIQDDRFSKRIKVQVKNILK